MPIWGRRGALEGLVHHSDRGSQYLAIRYTERLAEAETRVRAMWSGKGWEASSPRFMTVRSSRTIIGSN